MKGNTVNILVLGKEGVGKTALVVRFLTGRFLTEYAQCDEMAYERSITLDDKQVSLKVIDVGGKSIDKKSSSKESLQKIDGAVVVYSITDRHSFDVAESVVDWLRRERSSCIPLVLLGNKSDLDHSRAVTSQNSEDIEWRNTGYMISECSASSDSEGVTKIFHMLVRKILEKRDTHLKVQRKLSLSHAPLGSPKLIRAHLRRRFSVFTRERTSTM